ncbi:MAG: elongation factor P [bacterium]
MITTGDFRNGLNIEVDNDFYTVVWFQHHKPGKGGAVLRVKIKNIHTGAITERTFKSGERFREVNLERKREQFLYRDGDIFHFMNMETYDQIELGLDTVGENAVFFKENMEVSLLMLEDKIIGLELPNSVDLKVEYTEPGIKGDTVNNVLKQAELETGVQIKVPLFINIGDIVRVDTRTREYIGRA